MSIRPGAACVASVCFLMLPAPPAHAEDGVWKVGAGYVVRFENLDLTKTSDRRVLLEQVELAAAKACRGLRPAAKRMACARDAIRSVANVAGPSLSATLDVARFERDGLLQAAR
jgi:UrcA family protein